MLKPKLLCEIRRTGNKTGPFLFDCKSIIFKQPVLSTAMNQKILLILFLLLCNAPLLAQQTRQVQGSVTDTTHKPLPGLVIKLYTPGLKDTLSTFSDTNGSFNFSGLAASKFVIIISAMGYTTYEGHYSFAVTETNIKLAEITMVSSIKTLQEVVIGIAPVIIKTDTIEYKADSFKVKTDAYVEDLLKKLPGVQVNKNGEVTAQGKKVTKIKVNGKDFFGGDVRNATQQLPANIIDKVQVIDDYGDVAATTGIKNGEPDKIINLQFKKDKNNGFFGKVEAGYGTSNSFKAAVSNNYFNEKTQFSVIANSNNINNGILATSNNKGSNALSGLAITGSNAAAGAQPSRSGVPEGITTSHSVGTNFRIDFGKKNSFYGSYNFGQRNTYGFREIFRQFFYPTVNYVNNQRFEYNNYGYNHQANLNLEFYPDSFSYFKISPTFYYNTSNNNNITSFNYFKDAAIKTSEGYLRDTTKSSTPDLGANILYNLRFRKKGRNLSFTLGLGISGSNSKTNRPGFSRISGLSGSNSATRSLQ